MQDQIADQLAIRELVERSAIGVMRHDWELWGSTWDEDSTWIVAFLDEPARGRDNIVRIFSEKMATIEFVQMSCVPSKLVIEGNKATGETYCQELLFPKAGGHKIIVGCFHDQYIKRDGQWYFSVREYETLKRTSIET